MTVLRRTKEQKMTTETVHPELTEAELRDQEQSAFAWIAFINHQKEQQPAEFMRMLENSDYFKHMWFIAFASGTAYGRGEVDERIKNG